MREIYRDSRDMRPNERSAGNGGTALPCHIGRPWPAVPEKVNMSPPNHSVQAALDCALLFFLSQGSGAPDRVR